MDIDREAFTNKVYDLLITLFARQEGVEIEYHLIDKKDKKKGTEEPA